MELNPDSKKNTSALCMKNHYSLNDELYTPAKLVNVILPYLEMWTEEFRDCKGYKPVIWCPFDTEDSEFVRVLKEKGYNVTFSHLNTDQNFFEYEPENWDIAISNPPFSTKKKIFERLFNFQKPFAMLCNEMIINYQEIANMFSKHNIQMLCPDKKVSFNGKTSSFATGYFCWMFLPNDLIFTHMEDNNSGKNFVPAKLFKDREKK